MKINTLAKVGIITRGLLALAIGFPIFLFVEYILPDSFNDKVNDWLEILIETNRPFSFVVQKLVLWASTFDIFYYNNHHDSFMILENMARDNEIYIFSSIQQELFTLNNEKINSGLIQNPNLIPELFSKLFPQHIDQVQCLLQTQKFKYNNSKTQELLEKALLLI